MVTDRSSETALLEEGPIAEPDTLASHFDLLSDESRLQIIGALYSAGSLSPAQAVPFSAIFDRTDIADSGQFNYHLRRLRGPYVEKTADGYYLTHAGTSVGQMLDGSSGSSESQSTTR